MISPRKLEHVLRDPLLVSDSCRQDKVRAPVRRSRLSFLRTLLRSRWFWLAGLMSAAIIVEVRTSTLQAIVFSAYASGISFEVGQGPSDSITFPKGGPFDRNRGYPEIPNFVSRLEDSGFTVTRQARDSAALIRLIDWGIYPPYEQPPITGLRIHSSDGKVLHDVAGNRPRFETFDEIPDIVVRAVLFIENRELVVNGSIQQNPAVEWDRLGRAGLFYLGRQVGLPLHTEGGSTLAVQLEKYRHSPSGKTRSATEKLRQIVSASLRSYRSGTDTREERRKIVLEYLNTLPLAAQAGYGEVHGLAEGLHAWLGRSLGSEMKLMRSGSTKERAEALKNMLALLCAVRAPTYYLLTDRRALESRVSKYAVLMRDAGILDGEMAAAVVRAPLPLLNRAPARQSAGVPEKEVYSIRTRLLRQLGMASLYDLDRLHLDVNTTIDSELQHELTQLVASMKSPEFIDTRGLRAERLLGNSDPQHIVYSATLFERTPEGNLLRAQADTLNGPFNLGDGMKMELGSTAKLRTLAHYLEIVQLLYSGRETLSTDDPITVWANETLKSPMTLEEFLGLALDRKYSAASWEGFFTGGGLHTFSNFDSDMDPRRLTVRDAFRSSINLVFIRLMRDLVRFHAARLPYDADRVLNDTDYSVRHNLLMEAAETEANVILSRSYRRYRGLTEEAMIQRLLRGRDASIDRLTVLFYAWKPHGGIYELQKWLQRHLGNVSLEEAEHMRDSYDPARLNFMDYSYLLRLHPLELWCAGMLDERPGLPRDVLFAQSGEPRRLASTWLFKTKNRRAQDLRLRVRIEDDAFKRMTPYWQNLGFPFETLVPSLATAIGSSSDRPTALAELMGIILNDGVQLPSVRVTQMRFASETPYETVLGHKVGSPKVVMHPAIARVLREVLSDVVQHGTAQRLADAFVLPDGSRIVAGGKTGSGDNRYNTASTPNRTATFVFYVGNKYFGVVTAYVQGPDTEKYKFTSALAVTFVKMLSPKLMAKLAN